MVRPSELESRQSRSLDSVSGSINYLTVSRAELKSLVDRSSAAERLFLAAYLHHLTARDNPAVQQEVDLAHREIEHGKKISLRQLKQLHRTLEKTGL